MTEKKRKDGTKGKGVSCFSKGEAQITVNIDHSECTDPIVFLEKNWKTPQLEHVGVMGMDGKLAYSLTRKIGGK